MEMYRFVFLTDVIKLVVQWHNSKTSKLRLKNLHWRMLIINRSEL